VLHEHKLVADMRLAIALIVLLTTLPSATSKAIADNNDDSKLLFSKEHQRWIIIHNVIVDSKTTDNQKVQNKQHGSVMYKTKDQCISALLDIFEEQTLPWLAVKEPETILVANNFSIKCFMVSLKEADE